MREEIPLLSEREEIRLVSFEGILNNKMMSIFSSSHESGVFFHYFISIMS